LFGEGIYIWTLFRGVAASRPDDCWTLEEEGAGVDSSELDPESSRHPPGAVRLE
jgi:hypothetical protein